jgi:predicted RND superfamily exporter protein
MLRLWPDGQDLRRNFLNDGGDALRINLRCVEGVDVGEKLRMCAELEQKAKERFGPAYRIEVTGLYRFYAGLVSGLLRDQYDSLAITILAVAGVIALMLRSIRWMLLVMAVNLLPVAVCLGAMGWVQIPVNMTTAMMLGATQGLAVEDALHYVWRVRREYAERGNMPAALLRAHARVGRACVFTTVVVAGGFSILLLSEFLPTAYFGGLVGFTLCVALVANLVLLPILIDVFHPERKRVNRPAPFPASRAES